MTTVDMELKRIVEKFGIPEYLQQKYSRDELKFEFVDANIPNVREKGYHCSKENGVKFAIVNVSKGETIFTMDFFKVSKMMTAFRGIDHEVIRLELIYVHDIENRNRGIGSHFIKALKNYMKTENIPELWVIPNAKAANFKHEKIQKISKEKLDEYYLSFQDKDFKVLLLS